MFSRNTGLKLSKICWAKLSRKYGLQPILNDVMAQASNSNGGHVKPTAALNLGHQHEMVGGPDVGCEWAVIKDGSAPHMRDPTLSASSLSS